MLRTALRPRFLGLLALMVVATLVCGLLASWQWDRAHQAITDEADGAERRGDLEEVLDVGEAVTNAIVGDIVTATGHYDPDEQVVVPGRNIDGTDAAIVVTALQVDLADGSTARLPVARGWVPADELTGPDGEIDPTLAPEVPAGEVEVTGRLEASESASGGVDNGVVEEIATPMLVNEWGSPMYSGYLAQVDPNAGLQPMPEAESDFSKGLNWQNIGYSFQWVLFGGFFLYLWWRSVRTAYLDELAARREAMEESLRGNGPTESSEPAEPAESAESADPASGTPREPAVAGSSSPTASTSPTPDKDV
ncbi:SURF1 family protein [Brachybacterium sacelli]|uniref:SURF1-like protein n=1 Tax=Brachybacterium sacelli TaxID=173364 RepID=A0ABS4X0K9_9MICO|nr:SURF1 family protein [Brachybacterium sacelli]MBP2381985.1 cytochrome oxidase assembly protein ShyY1 [Brachybacterium sacelli]